VLIPTYYAHTHPSDDKKKKKRKLMLTLIQKKDAGVLREK